MRATAVTEKNARDLIDQAHADGVQKLMVGAYIIQDGRVLLLQRSSLEQFLPNLIELPGGKVAKGETLLAGLQREVMSETGLAVHSVDRYINCFDYLSGSGERTRQYNFAVTVSRPYAVKLNHDAHDMYFWILPTEKDLNSYSNLSDKTRQVILDAFKVTAENAP